MPKRRRVTRSTARDRRRPNDFAKLVERAVASIPSPFREALEQVAVVIADEPTADQLRENGLGPADTLYGLYEGVPLIEYGAEWLVSPNRISIFQEPLEEDFPDPDDLEDEVRLTVIHELAHHMGIDDERLSELGLA
jgi:predicted Zn-dependent protease with MMP-like domain